MATKVLDWPKHLLDELARNQNNGRVGGRLVSETERVRVWYIALQPGERLGFHKDVLNYSGPWQWLGRAGRIIPTGRSLKLNTKPATRNISSLPLENS